MNGEADMPLPFEVERLLPLVECVKPRTPKALRDWVLAKCSVFNQRPELRKPVLLHEGLFKWFLEEIYPLSVFAVHRYGDRVDVLCAPKRDQSHDVDAEINEPSRTIPVEITSAREPDHHLRMECLVQHHWVALTGPPLKVQGTKRTGRQIDSELESVDHRESRARYLSLIKTAAEGKAGLGRYGKNYELIIAVEDGWFDPDDANEVVAFIEREVLTLPLEFGAIHIVGLTERLFRTFPLGSLPC
jgi:hypothetical protein